MIHNASCDIPILILKFSYGTFRECLGLWLTEHAIDVFCGIFSKLLSLEKNRKRKQIHKNVINRSIKAMHCIMSSFIMVMGCILLCFTYILHIFIFYCITLFCPEYILWLNV